MHYPDRVSIPQPDCGRPPVVIVNETTVKMHFGGDNPLGKRVSFGGQKGPWREIVGVVRGGMVLVGVGIMRGLTGGLAGARSLESFFYPYRRWILRRSGKLFRLDRKESGINAFSTHPEWRPGADSDPLNKPSCGHTR